MGQSMLYKKIRLSEIGAIDYSTTDIIQLNDRWVIAHRDEFSISVTTGLLETSFDNSETFTKSLAFGNANKVINGYIFRNGNIVLTTIDNKIYLTNIHLTFITEKILYKADGITPYPIHNPVNSANPGRYFYTHRYPSHNDNNNVFVMGNYCNVDGGATPSIFIYTADWGLTFKIAYEFGVNPNYKDDGTVDGGTTGTSLGDSNNTVLARHTHASEYCEYNNKWYFFSGDHSANNEIHWLEAIYSETNDTWDVTKINFGFSIPESSFLKITDACFYNEYVYYCSDATAGTLENPVNGIYKVKVEDIADVNKHIKIIDFPDYLHTGSNLKINKDSGNLLFTMVINNAGQFATTKLGVATNYGEGSVNYKNYPDANFIRLNNANKKGYFRLDYKKTQTIQNKSFLIKVGNDLFNNV